MDGKAWVDALIGEELVCFRVRLRESDVVFVKSILEASEGLGAVFAEPRPKGSPRRGADGGAIVIAGHASRAAELRVMIDDLRAELDGALWETSRQD